MGYRRAREIRILGGRKDGGRGDGPIRHGGLGAIDGFICACPSHWRGVRSFVLRVLVELCRAVAVRRSPKAQHVKASTVQATHLNVLHGMHCFTCAAV
jgi:hypothetical protein